MTTAPALPSGTILGYPRIGRHRELKRAVEARWSGSIDAAELESRAASLRRATRERLAELGLARHGSAIPESFSFYDQVLDAALAAGIVPERFADLQDERGAVDVDGLFAIARGDERRAPLEMTKWFDTNYHYLVPEIGPATPFRAVADRAVALVAEAREQGFTTRPVLVGPVTLLALSKAAEGSPSGFTPLDRVAELVPVYRELLAALAEAGAEWVQIDEPALVSESLGVPRERVVEAARAVYGELGRDRPIGILVAAPYGELGDAFSVLTAAPIDAVALDLVRGAVPEGVHTPLQLVGGVVEGRNVWRGDLAAAADRLEALRAVSPRVVAGTSTSLQHAPHTLEDESELDGRLRSWLAFADEKVGQVAALARGLDEGRAAIAGELEAATAALADRRAAPGVRDGGVRARAASLPSDAADRGDLDGRRAAQAASLALPELPTTTIGSFPQTGEIRRARAAHARGELDRAGYEAFLRAEIREVVALQERLGLDVLVHGEPERNDMVQYFAEHLDGFAVTQHGWVQSYGSRATRPSILWGDVARPEPITVAWSSYAQSLTSKHVKGMLTGPVTILAWSFVRDDQPLGETAEQVALALRDEIADLEAAGIRIVQVDEPALRELLPLRLAAQPAYLDWSVRAFRLATAGAAPATQIHTHLCYSEFGAVIDAIDGLDADVTSIEAARSRMEVVDDLERSGFSRGIGPGVYDIHSPRVPGTEEISELLETAARAIPADRLWVNPDCGLKTRGYEETVASLEHLVEAARRVREGVRV
ncbi:5-methyltetrahydropteroyltriglutamate--homocysteine S-methyltransferase [Homoserinibacter sp. YIM 151385]|uniref:5-methyltetrahydropteroyltriglutamate-- homocysteine S-methyltransferase n=1 Tax=Homoserinibacter sp. YIM 151385 TaxID=2985506 RepID=UPI0022F06567|nr:5-methyltetrahydropteroyltriglutamate--homocysteine S-methyltransferase [Homoserinibacter sp. YIM 151385]WBU38889.1 5-methyltetrahydropteroyltriglutamate--homocysteine S-methyltransferase [Homoserinibacter sp. YIM 151385]